MEESISVGNVISTNELNALDIILSVNYWFIFHWGKDEGYPELGEKAIISELTQ